MITHKTMLHGRCPINDSWDYYVLTVSTAEFIACEEIEAACNAVRGLELTQEAMAARLRELLPVHCMMQLSGRHGQNCKTSIEV